MRPAELMLRVKRFFQQALEKGLNDYRNSDGSELSRQTALTDFKRATSGILSNTEFWVARDYDELTEDQIIIILRAEQLQVMHDLEKQIQGAVMCY